MNSPRSSKNNFKPSFCPHCGSTWSRSHRQNSSKRAKTCKDCEITTCFAIVCRKPENPIKSKPRVNNVDDVSSEAATVGTSAEVEEQVNQIDFMLQNRKTYDANSDFDYDDLDNCVAVICNDLREVEPVNMQLQIGNIETKTLVNSSSVCTIIRKSLANALVLYNKES